VRDHDGANGLDVFTALPDEVAAHTTAPGA
jgi:hypothetical protein